MKKLLLPLFILTQFVFANPPDWEYNPAIYEYAMYMNVFFSDESLTWDDADEDMLAAFGEDGTVRSLGIPLEPPFGPYQGQILWELTIGSNYSEGEIIYFMYYYLAR